MSPQPAPLPEITPAPIPTLSDDLPELPNHLVARQSIVTQTIVASPGVSSAASGSSSSGGGGFPVAVAVPALIGGMALALLGALAWWYFQRRRAREQKRRWEARQKRQNRKRAESNATSRPSISGGRPTPGRGLSEKEKEIPGSIPPVPPLPTLNKEYGYGQPQASTYQYPAQDQYGQPAPQQYGQYNQYDQYGQHPVQPAIDTYGQQPAADPFTPEQPDYSEEYKPNSPEALAAAAAGAPPAITPKSSSRGAKRVELAENAAARETADPNTRWRPNKPSPLALAAEKKRLEAGGASLSPSRSIGGGAGYGQRTSLEPPTSAAGESNWEYQEELSTPHDPDYTSRRSQDVSGQGRQVSGEWGVAGEVHSGGASADSHYPYRQSEDRGYTNDPYLSAQKAAAGGMEDDGTEASRAASGLYSTDPYAVYHGGAGPTGGKAKVGGWV